MGITSYSGHPTSEILRWAESHEAWSDEFRREVIYRLERLLEYEEDDSSDKAADLLLDLFGQLSNKLEEAIGSLKEVQERTEDNKQEIIDLINNP